MPSLPVSIDVKTSADFQGLPRRLREAAEAGLRREVSKALTRAVRGVERDVRRSAVRILPREGGLGTEVSQARITQSQRFAGQAVLVEITASHEYDLAGIDRGRLRHPLYGNRRHWFTQRVKPRWWSDPTSKSGPKIRAALDDAMTAIARRIDG